MGVVHSRIDLSLRCLGAIDLCVCNLSTFFCFLQALCPLDTSAEQTVPIRMVVAISPQAWRGRVERHREDLVGPAVPGAASFPGSCLMYELDAAHSNSSTAAVQQQHRE